MTGTQLESSLIAFAAGLLAGGAAIWVLLSGNGAAWVVALLSAALNTVLLVLLLNGSPRGSLQLVRSERDEPLEQQRGRVARVH